METKKPRRLEFTPEELARIEQRKLANEGIKLDREWFLLAEFGYYFGWEAIRDVKENKIDIATFNHLLVGARKVWAQKVTDLSVMTYTSVVATNSKKPNDVMKKGMKDFYNEAKV